MRLDACGRLADGREQASDPSGGRQPAFFALSGGGPDVKDSAGNDWTAVFIDANGDPTVDLRSNLAAESRAKIVYEYLKQFTDDPSVQSTLTFLMTREIAHYQQFTAALNELPVNFRRARWPATRFQNVAFNMSNGGGNPFAGGGIKVKDPGRQGMKWKYVQKPEEQWLGTKTA